MEISGLDDYLHLSDAGSAYVEPAMIMVKLIFLVSTLVQENNLYGSVALWGSDLS